MSLSGKSICYIVFYILVLIIASGCSQSDFDVEPGNPEFPGSILRDAASAPASITEELLVISDYEQLIEDSIAGCMRSNGFEYFVDHNESRQRILDLSFDLPPEDYASEFGFGILNGAILGMKPHDSLNTGYLRSLNSDEIESYRITLNGSAALAHPGSDVLKIGGCRRAAFDSVDQPVWYSNLDWLTVVSEELFQRISADPRIIDIDQQWAHCMSGLGYNGFATEAELGELLEVEFAHLFANLVPTQPFNDGNDFVSKLDEESKAALVSFRSKEIELAVASHECSRDHDEAVALISKEIERKIMSSHPLN